MTYLEKNKIIKKPKDYKLKKVIFSSLKNLFRKKTYANYYFSRFFKTYY